MHLKQGGHMATESKYAELTKKLMESGEEIVTYTFAELNEIIEIPQYAYNTRSAWANCSNPAPFAAAWLNAGYTVKRGEQGSFGGRIAHPFSLSQNPSATLADATCGDENARRNYKNVR